MHFSYSKVGSRIVASRDLNPGVVHAFDGLGPPLSGIAAGMQAANERRTGNYGQCPVPIRLV